MSTVRRACVSALAVAPLLMVAGYASAYPTDEPVGASPGTAQTAADPARRAELLARQRVLDERADLAAIASIPQVTTRPLCGDARPGFMRCYAQVVTHVNGQELLPMAGAQGYGPSDLRSAYKLPSSGGAGKIVAIVDAQDAPNAEDDLATYRSHFGLPDCTSANGCFKKVNQDGQEGNYPDPDNGWAGEIALDLDMVSAVCPDCKILLVEANSASTQDLGAAVNTAAKLGAAAISNSYGGPEDSSVTAVSSQYYKHPGILITASSGDNGYGTSFPASSQYVLGVGGTSLKSSSSSRGWAETAWSSAGSGCSRYIGKPSYQADSSCSKRTVADVSAVANPATGVAVYDGGWQVVGGTSASAPIIAGIFTLLGLNTIDLSFPYAHTSAFYDVTSGTNGSCGGTYLCTAGPGFDGPTGLGTPNGSLLASNGGPPPVPDAGPPATPDAGSGGTPDAGFGGADASGPVDDGDGGATEPPQSSDGGSSANDPPTRDAGKGARTKDGGDNSDQLAPDVVSQAGCGCAVPGGSSPLGRGASAVLALGALALVASRRRRGA